MILKSVSEMKRIFFILIRILRGISFVESDIVFYVIINKSTTFTIEKKLTQMIIRLMMAFMSLSSLFLSSQEVNKQQTIEYINANYPEGIKVDGLGNISIGGKVKFSYKNVELSQMADKAFSGKINFYCNNKSNCIEKIDGSNAPRVFTYSVKIEDRDTFVRLQNAFDHLLGLLKKEKPDGQDKDPFAPQNYKKN